MKCPFCGSAKSYTQETRSISGSGTRRRRQCCSCGQRFTTYEYTEKMMKIAIIKLGRESILRDVTYAAEKAVTDAAKKAVTKAAKKAMDAALNQ